MVGARIQPKYAVQLHLVAVNDVAVASCDLGDLSKRPGLLIKNFPGGLVDQSEHSDDVWSPCPVIQPSFKLTVVVCRIELRRSGR